MRQRERLMAAAPSYDDASPGRSGILRVCLLCMILTHQAEQSR